MEKARMLRKEQAVVGGTEGGRSPTGVPTTPAAAAVGPPPGIPDPEVPEKPVRRQFTAEYKQRILEEADRCTQPGQLGQLLRREGLYSSHLITWRRQRERGVLSGLAPKRRGRKPKRQDPLVQENQQLRREIERLGSELKKAETIIEVQKKLSEVLEISRQSHSMSENDE
jgi:transposase